jgi:hypothetical protein
MLPWGHLAVGYLVYTVLVRVRGRHTPAGVPTLVLALGTQLPDLVDKPLNWWFGIFDGRGIGHSLLAVTALCLLVAFAAYRYDRLELAGALSVGLYTHLLGDSYQALLSGEFARAAFLLWPLVPAPTYPKDSLFEHLDAWVAYLQLLPRLSPAQILASGFGFQLALLFVLFVIWVLDGFPGVGTIWRIITRWPADAEATRTSD